MRIHTISFRNAIRGLTTAATTQLNLRIHLAISILVIIFSLWLKISASEALILLFAISLVLTSELFNTAVEFLGDAITLENNCHIKCAKDISAGAVLTSSIFAVLTGLAIFFPKLILLINH